MKLTASKTAINIIVAYCNKHIIAFEQRNNQIIEVVKTEYTVS